MKMPRIEEGVVWVLIDVQERLVKAMSEFAPVRDTQRRALRIAQILKTDVLVTEQYPQGLGPTIPELREVLPPNPRVFSKTTFGCWGCAEFANAIDATRPRHLLILGMEAHVCVQQTVLGALERGYNPVLIADGICSRKAFDRDTAFELMRHAGATVTTLEAAVFNLLRDAAHPQFKEVSKLFREA